MPCSLSCTVYYTTNQPIGTSLASLTSNVDLLSFKDPISQDTTRATWGLQLYTTVENTSHREMMEVWCLGYQHPRQHIQLSTREETERAPQPCKVIAMPERARSQAGGLENDKKCSHSLTKIILVPNAVSPENNALVGGHLEIWWWCSACNWKCLLLMVLWISRGGIRVLIGSWGGRRVVWSLSGLHRIRLRETRLRLS